MRTPRFRLFLTCAALAMFALGCAKKPAEVMAPIVDGSSGRAPVIMSRAAIGSAVAGAYIVVFKEAQATSDVDGVVNELSTKHGLNAQFRYKHALRGFAAKLTPAAVEAGLASVLTRLSAQGEVAHEEDIGERAILDHLQSDGSRSAA